MAPWLRRLRGVVAKTFKALLGVVVLLLGYAGLFTVRSSFLEYPLIEGEMTQLRGAYHVHTTLSDGRATPEHVARLAAAAGLSFVILTDHNVKVITGPKYEAGVLLIYGTELSTPAGHLVALGLKTPLDAAEREQDAVRKVVDQGAIAILAHPVQPKRPWTDWEAAKQVNGFELYSADSMFRDAQRSPFSVLLPALGSYLATPMQGFMIVSERKPEASDKLLALSSTGEPLLTPCAADAHGLPPYLHEFKALSTVLPAGTQLAQDPVAAQEQVLTLLRTGAAYCAFHGIAAADGFVLSAQTATVTGEQHDDPAAPDGGSLLATSPSSDENQQGAHMTDAGSPSAAPTVSDDENEHRLVTPDGGSFSATRTVSVGEKIHVALPKQLPPGARVEVFGQGRLLQDGITVEATAEGALQIEVWADVPSRLFGVMRKPWIVASPIRVLPAAP